MSCRLKRNGLGAWCGYVKVHPNHRWHGCTNLDIDTSVNVHGGVTFCGEGCGFLKDGFWVGFDCSHLGDKMPDRLECSGCDSVYRTMEYAKEQCERLAEQATLDEVAGWIAKDAVGQVVHLDEENEEAHTTKVKADGKEE